MPDPALPPSVYQGLGWGPAADPNMAPPVPMPPDGPLAWGGLSPSIPQGMGWTPPPDAPPLAPQLPPTPTDLPSSQGGGGGPQPAGPGGAPDFQVPPSAFGKRSGGPPSVTARPGAAPVQPAPARPTTFGQDIAGLQQREQGTEAAGQAAIDAKVAAQHESNAAALQTYQQGDEQLKANAEERKAADSEFAKAHATNTAAVLADRANIDSWKFNRNKYLDDLGVGGKVRYGIGMVLAGIGQGMMRQGGANPVMEMLQQNIHDANVAQYKERDALVEKLGFDRQTGMDAAQYHATRIADIEKKDASAYTATARMLQESALKTADPAARAAGMEEAAKLRGVADGKYEQFVQLKSQHDLQQQQIGIAGASASETRRHNLVQEGFEKYKEDQDAQIRAAALLAKQQGKISDQERKFAGYAETMGDDGKPTGKVDVLRNSDGSVWQARDAETARDIGKLTSEAAVYNRLVGDMSRDISEHGGESGYFKSDAWKRQQVRLAEMQAELHHTYGIQRFSEGTQQLFDQMATGGVKPTSFIYDATNALQTSAKDLESKVNDHLTHEGYTGRRVALVDTSNPPTPQESPDDRLYKVVSGSRSNDPGAIYNPTTGKFDPKVTGFYSVDPDAPATGPAPTSQDRRIAAEYPRMGAGQKAGLDMIAAQARSDDPALRTRALQHLEDLARPGGKANEDGVRGYAQELLTNLVQPPEPTEPTTGGTDTALQPYGRSQAPQPPAPTPPALRLQQNATRR